MCFVQQPDMTPEDIDGAIVLIYPKARRAAGKYFANREDRLDLVQNTLEKVLRNWQKYHNPSVWTVPYFLYALKYTAYEEYDRRKRRPAITDSEIPQDQEPASPSPMSEPDRDEWSEQLLAELPDRQREVVRAIVIDGEKPQEVANRLGLAPGTVYRYKHLALQNLRAKLRDQDQYLPD